MAEVEVFSPKKLQRALTFTDAEIETDEGMADMIFDVEMNRLRLGEVSSTKIRVIIKYKHQSFFSH